MQTSTKGDIEVGAMNARSREKTGLAAKDGDEDLIDYYHLVMHPNTTSTFERSRGYTKTFKNEVVPRLKDRFGQFPLFPKYDPDYVEESK